MGCSSWTSHDWDSYSSSKITGQSTAKIYSSTTVKNDFDPKGIKVRESCDSDNHPNSNAIIIGLDVTGSMSDILNGVAQKLGDMMNEILSRQPITDPQIMFTAIGDHVCDRHPFQATQFESDIKIAKQLTEVYFEQGGGGNGFESYPLAWYFAARHTAIDCYNKRNQKGFIFTMGDDCYPDKIPASYIKEIFGDTVGEDISTKAILSEVNRKYEVFHLILDRDRGWGGRDTSNIAKWRELMGERVIKVSDYTKVPEIIVSILETMGGKSLDEVVNSWDGSTAIVVKDALSNLTAVSQKNDLVTF